MKKKSKKVQKPDLTEIAVIMDESGSMGSVTNDVIGGYNTFIEDQKKEKGECKLTLTKFHTEVNQVFEGKDIQDVEDLSRDTYTPGGSTALFDAIVKTIKAMKKRLSTKYFAGKQPKVLFLIMTDGEENSSVEVRTKAEVKKIIEDCQKSDGYEFMYIGANQDAFAESSSMGIHMSSNYVADSKGTRAAYQKMSAVACCYRTTGNLNP